MSKKTKDQNRFEIKERPILFSTEMVQAILSGEKTQTRRVIKHGLYAEPKYGQFMPWDMQLDNSVACLWNKEGVDPTNAVFDGYDCAVVKCPYSKFGEKDLLWVRETYSPEPVVHGLRYKSNLNESGIEHHKRQGYKWKPSIHMPKAAARIWLKVTNVRVERLHEITEEDAVKEGAPIGRVWGQGRIGGSHREGFIEIWQRINGWDSWKANPWVWVIEFEVVSRTGRP